MIVYIRQKARRADVNTRINDWSVNIEINGSSEADL